MPAGEARPHHDSEGGPRLDVFDCEPSDDIVTDSVAEANQVRAAGCG